MFHAVDIAPKGKETVGEKADPKQTEDYKHPHFVEPRKGPTRRKISQESEMQIV